MEKLTAQGNAHWALSRPMLIRGASVCVAVILLALSAPMVWAAVSAGAGLVALAAMGIAGVAALQALPLAAQKLENRMLAMRKAEAAQNPIEQLQNDCLRREKRLKDFRHALVSIGGQIESMREMLQERKRVAPGHVLARQEQAIVRMEHFYRANIGRLEDANQALEMFREQVQQKVFEWKFATLGGEIMRSLNPSEMNDLMQGLLTDEALRSVQDRFNTVFAELDIDMRSMSAPSRKLLDADALSPLEALHLNAYAQQGGTP